MTHTHFQQFEKKSSDNDSVSIRSSSIFIVFIFTVIFLFVEIIGGIVSGSLSLIADGFHMTTDAFALSLSLIAFWISQKPTKPTHTFGFRRAEIIAALLNGVLLIILSITIVIEAFSRFNTIYTIDTGLMFYIALIGLLINIFGIYKLKKDKSENLNMKGAFLHLVGDTLGSIGALSAAIIIFFTGEVLIDVLVSLFIMILLLYNGFNLFKESLHILMEGTPLGMDVKKIENEIRDVEGVIEVHDMHCWSVSSNINSISCHVRVEEHSSCQPILLEIQKLLKETFKINHCTVQMEHCLSTDDYNCDDC